MMIVKKPVDVFYLNLKKCQNNFGHADILRRLQQFLFFYFQNFAGIRHQRTKYPLMAMNNDGGVV